MKIAVIRSEVSYAKGGAERYAANLSRVLCEMGHEVWVLAEILGEDVHPAIHYVPIKVQHWSSAARHRSFQENAQAALANIEPEQTIALARSFPSDAFRVSAPLHCFWMGIRYPGMLRSFIEHLNPRHRTILRLERAIFDPHNTRSIVTNSQLSKKLIGKFYPTFPQERIRVIYNGVDHDQFKVGSRAREDSTLRLLFVGQDFKRKGLAAVISAVAAAIAQGCDCQLRVVGRDDAAPYQTLADQLSIGERIHFTGATKNIEAAYQGADLFVFPSLYDPFANVVLECLACGTPVITTTTNGSSEVIIEGANGYVVEGQSSDLVTDITSRILNFAALPESTVAEMRSHARQTAENFTVRKNAEQFLQHLQSDV
jgi:UDP-glucose:(heptosyl)LPS alpha-1,3-glucosyltransferase